jgi:hypothetical protein
LHRICFSTLHSIQIQVTDAQGVIAVPLQFHPGRNKSDRLQLSTPEGKTRVHHSLASLTQRLRELRRE